MTMRWSSICAVMLVMLPAAACGGGGLTVDEFQKSYASMLGNQAKVAGLYLNTNSTTSGGKKTYNIVVVGEKGKLKPSVACEVGSEPKGLMQYDKVVVQGKVGKRFGDGFLEQCSFSK